MADIRVRVSYEEVGADRATEDEAPRSLVQDLELVPSAQVEPDSAGAPPKDARGVDAPSVQAILVTVPAAITAIQSLLTVLRSWQRRRRGVGTSSGSLKVRLGGDELDLGAADEETTARIVNAWRRSLDRRVGVSMARLALFVSSSAYADTHLAQLPSTRDAIELGDLFADPRIGQFTVSALESPTAQEFHLALEDLFADAEPNDLVVLYLSGHGLKDMQGNLYFAAHDTRPDRLQSTAVSAQLLCSLLNSSRAESAPWSSWIAATAVRSRVA